MTQKGELNGWRSDCGLALGLLGWAGVMRGHSWAERESGGCLCIRLLCMLSRCAVADVPTTRVNACVCCTQTCRLVQLEPFATGLDGGCVYGNHLVAAILPPLDGTGTPQLGEESLRLPPKARRFELGGSGLPAWLVSVKAHEVWCKPGGD